MSDEVSATLERRVTRLEHLLWAVGAIAAVFGITGALAWSNLLEAKRTAGEISTQMNVLRAELPQLAEPIVKDAALRIVKDVALQEVRREAPVAFSVTLSRHVSGGPPALIAFDKEQVNEGGMWKGSSVFQAPVSGIYFFGLTFTRDAFDEGGTEDDVFVSVLINDTEQGSAWAGQGDGPRANGMFVLGRRLKQGDRVEVRAESDRNQTRFLRNLRFTGFLLRGISEES